MTVDENDQIYVTQCWHHVHRLNLSHPDAATAKPAILRESLKEFTSEHSVASTDRVATQWPSIQSLARFVTIPRAREENAARHYPEGGSASDPLSIARGLLGFIHLA